MIQKLKKLTIVEISSLLTNFLNKICRGFEDEFLVNFVMNLLENQADDPRKIELQLRGNI